MGDKDEDYKHYPERTVTHTGQETAVICKNCFKSYSTDARQIVARGVYTYRPVTDFIVYHRQVDAYFCVTPCQARKLG